MSKQACKLLFDELCKPYKGFFGLAEKTKSLWKTDKKKHKKEYIYHSRTA